jgi:hypothetical protein
MSFPHALADEAAAGQTWQQIEDNGPAITYRSPKTTPVKILPKELGLCMALASRDLEPVTKLSISLRSLKCIPYQSQYTPYSPSLSKAVSSGNLRQVLPVLEIDIGIAGMQGGNSLANYLAGDPSRDCDLGSGHEDQLKSWVLSQPNHSIDPVAIYRKSLELNRGNIFLALITVHQIMRTEARWWDIGRYSINNAKIVKADGKIAALESLSNDELNFFDKFTDIRGDLRERGKPYFGDHPGTWYRIWGAMIYRLSFVRPQDFERHADLLSQCDDQSLNPLENWVSNLNDARVAIAFNKEENYNKGGKEKDHRKFEYDLAAAEAVMWLYRGLDDPKQMGDAKIDARFCQGLNYLSAETESGH